MLPTILDKVSIARLDLSVFSDQHDVTREEINKRQNRSHDLALENLAEGLNGVGATQQSGITNEAVDTIHAKATELYWTFFCEDIPLTRIDIKWKLARLSELSLT